MGKKKTELFSQEDWNAGTTIDRLYMYLMEPNKWYLTDMEFNKLEKLRQVWGIMCDNMVQRDRIKLITAMLDNMTTERTIKGLMQDAQHLFGDILTINAELELYILKEQYYELAQLARKAKDFDTAKRCLDGARDIVYRIRDKQENKPLALPDVVFSDSAMALQATDAEFEEVHLLEPQTDRVPERAATLQDLSGREGIG